MDKEFVYTSFQCTMTEDHCVNAAKGEGEVRQVWGGGGRGKI